AAAGAAPCARPRARASRVGTVRPQRVLLQPGTPLKLRGQVGADGPRELVGGNRALELALDPAVATDEERPGLRRQAPLPHPAVVALRRVVVPVDLDVDEANPATREAPRDRLDDVHHWPADAARAEARGREGHDERLVRSQ